MWSGSWFSHGPSDNLTMMGNHPTAPGAVHRYLLLFGWCGRKLHRTHFFLRHGCLVWVCLRWCLIFPMGNPPGLGNIGNMFVFQRPESANQRWRFVQMATKCVFPAGSLRENSQHFGEGIDPKELVHVHACAGIEWSAKTDSYSTNWFPRVCK